MARRAMGRGFCRFSSLHCDTRMPVADSGEAESFVNLGWGVVQARCVWKKGF